MKGVGWKTEEGKSISEKVVLGGFRGEKKDASFAH